MARTIGNVTKCEMHGYRIFGLSRRNPSGLEGLVDFRLQKKLEMAYSKDLLILADGKE